MKGFWVSELVPINSNTTIKLGGSSGKVNNLVSAWVRIETNRNVMIEN